MKNYRYYTDEELLLMRSSITKDLLKMQNNPTMDYYLPDPASQVLDIEDELLTRIPQSFTNDIEDMKQIVLYTAANPFDGKHPGFLTIINHFARHGYQVILKNIGQLISHKKPVPGVKPIEVEEVYLQPFIVRSYFRHITQDYFDQYLKDQPLRVTWRRNSYEVEVIDGNKARWIINANWVREKK